MQILPRSQNSVYQLSDLAFVPVEDMSQSFDALMCALAVELVNLAEYC
jgi:hypothetical protein